VYSVHVWGAAAGGGAHRVSCWCSTVCGGGVPAAAGVRGEGGGGRLALLGMWVAYGMGAPSLV